MGIMMPETCWDKSLIINIRLVASCWFLSLHPTFMMHGHKNLKFANVLLGKTEISQSVTFEVSRAVITMVTVFWYVTPCSLVYIELYSSVTCCFSHRCMQSEHVFRHTVVHIMHDIGYNIHVRHFYCRHHTTLHYRYQQLSKLLSCLFINDKPCDSMY
jgi:hypothetical protein